MLDAEEWPLFVVQLLKHPWRAPRYCLALIKLVCRRIEHRLRILVQSDVHRGLKQRPKWLTSTLAAGSQKGRLRLPRLEIAGAMPIVDMPVLRADDSEAYFASHRWGNCVIALGDEMLARAAFDDVPAWLAQPPGRADAAWESYSCCERVVNLAFLLAAHPTLLRDAEEVKIWNFFEEAS